ncbi:MFS transporter [Actinomadura barringtoniae]|uniref:MFS transporter n=1 Tax=Actinomadura barringtoniae TaxID=1427535 RepID=A0A939T554_9ACTN|nr:MFS transporter [Actinomadura barringtoniae]MBO2449109.1 MFS transporter [Actinomadura barringtoniae]
MRTSSTPALLALSLGYFSLGTASLAVIGLSAPIGADLHVQAATVGTLVTVFALVFAIAAPVAAIALGRMCRKRLLLLGLALMIVGGVGSAVAPSFGLLTAARVVAGLGAAIYGPAASAAGSLIVPPERRPRALATVFAGMTAATVLGVPVASSVGGAVGWRWAMAGVVALTAVAMGMLAWLLPPIEPGPAPTARVFRDVLRTPGTLPMVSTTLLVLAAQFTVYGVAGAYLAERFGASQTMVSLVLFVFGAIGMAGNATSARMFERLGGARTILITLAGLAVTFAALTATPGTLGLGIAIFAFWAFFSATFMSPQQARLVELLPEQRGILLALNASALYLGMSLGSLIGSGLLPGLGARWLSALAFIPLALAFAAHAASDRHGRRSAETAPQVPALTTN